ncbi:O147 family O-antigen polymerase, partial [Shigella flexneri]|nr:O147 family O-antigen polymerase [Shigella flexneri]
CAYFCSYGTISIVKIFLYLMVLQAVIISIISIYMTKTYGIGDYSALRHYFLENDYGDVYTYGSGFYRVQIKGNALIPFAFMLHIVIKDYFYYRFKNTITVILAIGTIVAGNFAYFVSICLFFMYIILCSKSNSRYAKLRKIIFGVFLTVILPFFITYSIELIIMKSNGADSSLGVRWDQFTVLINDLTESVSNFVIGSGLGNVIKIQTPIRDYSAYIYYELQSVYFLNQLGVILFTLFLLINLLLTIKIIKYSELCVLYFLYVSYAITNPYILDSNHVAVIIVLVTLSNVLKKMKAK